MRTRALRVETLEKRRLLSGDLPAVPSVEDWTQRGGDAGHTSFVDVRLRTDISTETWSQSLGYEQSGTGSWYERAVAADESHVYRTALEGYAIQGTYHIIAYNRETGDEVWHQTLQGHAHAGVGEPSLSGDLVFVNSAGHSSTSGDVDPPTLYALNRATGEIMLRHPYQGQWSSNERPVIADDQLIVEDGYFGGITAYTASTLVDQWHVPGSLDDSSYAALDDEFAYTNDDQVFQRADGVRLADITHETLSDIRNPIVSDSGRVLFDANVQVGDAKHACVAAFDGDTHSLLWTALAPESVAYKAVGDGRVAVTSGAELIVLNEVNGTQSLSWSAPRDFRLNEVILTQTHAIVQATSVPTVKGAARVYAVDLATGKESILFENSEGDSPTMEMAMRGNELFLSHHQFVRRLTLGVQNFTPTAADDVYATSEDVPMTLDVLANDTDLNGDSLTVATISDPAHGTAAINADGTVTYTPDADYHGSDSFIYTASDGAAESKPAEVQLTVAPINDPPTNITLSDSVLTEDADTTSAVAIGTLSATDADDSSHEFSLVAGVGDGDNALFQTTGAILELRAGTSLDFQTRSSYSVRVRASDGDAGVEKAFSITVIDANSAPVAEPLEVTTQENEPVVVSLAATDEDGNVDLVGRTAVLGFGANYELMWMPGAGDSTFAAPISIAAAGSAPNCCYQNSTRPFDVADHLTSIVEAFGSIEAYLAGRGRGEA